MSGARLLLGRIATPIGEMLLLSDEAGRLLASDFSDCEARFLRLLARRDKPVTRSELREAQVPLSIATVFQRYFDGETTAPDEFELLPGGTEFQTRAWAALRRIPAGQTRSYGAQADSLGQPGAARAVGHANQANPCSIVLPCHRLTSSSGALTGYAGGIWRKAWLLAHEKKHAGPGG